MHAIRPHPAQQRHRVVLMHIYGSLLHLRPIMMTALTAIFGRLPAALPTRIGA